MLWTVKPLSMALILGSSLTVLSQSVGRTSVTITVAAPIVETAVGQVVVVGAQLGLRGTELAGVHN